VLRKYGIPIENTILPLEKNTLFENSKYSKDFATAFKPFNLVLVALVSGLNEIAEISYEVGKIHAYLEFATIMSYDFYEIPLQLSHMGHHDQTFAESNSACNKTSAVDFWLARGFPKQKLNLGLSLYARTFLLFINKSCQLGGMVNREGRPGNYTQIPGILSYYEVYKSSIKISLL
jgi:chitinase